MRYSEREGGGDILEIPVKMPIKGLAVSSNNRSGVTNTIVVPLIAKSIEEIINVIVNVSHCFI